MKTQNKNKFKRNLILTVTLLILTILKTYSQSAPDLKSCKTYGLLAKDSIYANGACLVNGDAGTNGHISSSINVIGSAYQNASGNVSTALADLDTAITFLNNLTGITIGNDLNNTHLNGGIYTIIGSASLSGKLFLDGDSNSVYIFKVSDSLLISASGSIEMTMVKPTNIYWMVDKFVSIENESVVPGIILSNHNISVNAPLAKSSFLCKGVLNITVSTDTLFTTSFASYNFQNNKTIVTPCSGTFVCSLVRNGDMEDKIQCPTTQSSFDNFICSWQNCNGASPDYLNSCNTVVAGTPPVGVPLNIMGNQNNFNPIVNGGYSGIFTYWSPSTAREYIQQQLFQPLVTGHKYYAESNVSLADNCMISVDQLGMYISQTAPNSTGYNLLNGSPLPQIESAAGTPLSHNINNSTWTKIAGFYNATGGENFITIGNFRDFTNHIFTELSGTINDSYYYIDQVIMQEVPAAGPNQTICSGGQTVQLGQSNCGSLFTYKWLPLAGIVSGATTSNPIVSPSVTTTYTFTVQSGTNLTSSTVTVYVNPTIVFSITGGNSMCTGSTKTLDAGIGYTSYHWSMGANTENINISSIGSYTVTVTNANGCSGSASITVVTAVNTVPPPQLSGDHYACTTNHIYNVVNPVGTNYSYTWTTSFPFSNGTTPYTIVDFSSVGNGNIYYTVTDNTNGCTASSTFRVYPCCTSSPTPQIDLTNKSVHYIINNPSIFQNYYNPFQHAFTTNISSTPAITVAINGIFTIDADFNFEQANVVLGPQAKIVVEDGFNFTVGDNSYLHSCNRDYMWDGIYLSGNPNPSGNSSFVNISGNVVIEDAMNALVSNACGNFFVMGTNFNNNNKSVVVNDCSILNPHPGMIYHSSINCNSNLIQPYLGLRPVCGIQLNNVDYIKIGNENNVAINPPAYQNIFNNLNCGIEVSNSQVEIVNNAFSNIPPSNKNQTSSGYGIYISDRTLTMQTTVIGGSNLGLIRRSNTFTDCSNGIYTTGRLSATIYNNYFNNILNASNPNLITNDGKCIKAVGTKFSNYAINSNKFSNFTQGIYLNNFITSNVVVYGNFFNATGIINNLGNTAIYLGNPVSTLNPTNTQVTGNIIKHCKMGINISGFDLINAAENNIEFTDADLAASAKPFYGINLFNSSQKGISIESNTISKTGGNPTSTLDIRLFGINVQTSENSIVSSNVITKMGTGVRYFSTAFTNTLSCNIMDQNYVGLKLESSNIGDQGNAGASQDNQWSNLHYDIEGLNTTYLTNFYSKSPNLPWTPTIPKLYPQLNYLFYNPTPSPNNCAAPCIPCLRALLLDVVNETGDFGLLSAEEQYQAVLAAYNTLKADPSLMNYGDTNDVDLQLFYNDVDQNNAGRLADASALVNHDTTAAANIVSTVSPVNTAEENMRTLLEIYSATWARDYYNLSNEQFNILYAIAIQSPISGGGAVYGARIMTETDVDDFANTANKGGSGVKLISMQPYGKGRLFPNPTNDIVYYSLRLKKEQHGMLSLFDIAGKPLQTIAINKWNYYTAISLRNYNIGMYILKVTVDDKPFETLKFVKQ